MARKVVSIELNVDGRDAKRVVSSLKKEFGDLDPKIDGTSKKFSKMGTAIGAAVAAIGVREVAQLTKRVFDLGSAVEETESKFVTSLGEQADAGREFLNEYSTLLGLTDQKAKDFLATQVNIAKGLGFTGEEAFDLSKEVVKLAGDLSSFNNIPIERTLNAIQGGLTGEREALKSLGIVVRQQDVDQRALLNTGKERVEQLTEQEKSLASFQIITERAGIAVGDLERTQDSAANQARQLQAEIGNLVNELSVALLPALAEGLRLTMRLVEGFKYWLDDLSDAEKAAELSAVKVNSLVDAMADLRREIEAAKTGATVEEMQILTDAYEATTEHVRAQASALWDETHALKQNKIALEEQLEAMGNAKNIAQQQKQIRLQDDLAELNVQITSNSSLLQEYIEFLNGVTDATDGVTDATDGVTDATARANAQQNAFGAGIGKSTQQVKGLTLSTTENTKAVDLSKAKYIELKPAIDDTSKGVSGLSGAFLSGAAAAQSGIKGLIKSIINQAIAVQVTKALTKVPFPFNLAIAGGAGFAVSKLMDKLIPGFAGGVTDFGGGLAMVGEVGRELVQLPQGSNVITNQNTESIISAASRASTTESMSTIGAQSPDMVGAFVEALEKADLKIKGTLKGRDIELSYDRRKEIGTRYTTQIG